MVEVWTLVSATVEQTTAVSFLSVPGDLYRYFPTRCAVER